MTFEPLLLHVNAGLTYVKHVTNIYLSHTFSVSYVEAI